jgi:hypothetical protein
MNKKYVIAYIPKEEKSWKFLCIDDGKEIKVIYDYNTKRKNDFISTTLYNTMYIVRDATQDDLDEALINKL